jgi:hypothetical protein
MPPAETAAALAEIARISLMRGVATVIVSVLIIGPIAYQTARQPPQDALSAPSTLRSDATRIADDLAKEHPEPAVPGHYPGDCVAGQHRWVTPVQGYVMDWCAIELRTNGRGNIAATAYVDSSIRRGFTENVRLTVRYDFDCAGNFSINLSPPLPITAAGPVSTPYLIGNAVCIRAGQLLSQRR